MRGLIRMLIMFGPMIFRQIQKFQRNKTRQLQRENYDRPTVRERHRNTRQQTHSDQNKDRYLERKEPYSAAASNKKPEISAEEKNFNLKEEDIMLDDDDLKYLKKDDQARAEIEENIEDIVEDLPAEKKNTSDIDLEDLQDLFDE